MKRLIFAVLFMLLIVGLALPIQLLAAQEISRPFEQRTDQAGTTGVIATIKVPWLNVRRIPDTTGSIRGILGLNATVPLIGRTLIADWVEAQTLFGRGWLDARFISTNVSILSLPVTEAFIPPFATVVTSTPAIVRRGPYDEYPVIARYGIGAELDVIGLHRNNTHVQVLTPNGIGWVSLKQVRVKGDVFSLPVTDRLVPPLARVINYRVRVRAAPDLNASILGLIRLGRVYDILGQTADKAWLLIKSPFGQGWIEASLVEVIGFLQGTEDE
jgi:hypothetical protein